MTAPRPAAIIETALERSAGAAPSIATNAIMQALKAHGLRIVVDTSTTITYCPEHPSTKMPCHIPHTETLRKEQGTWPAPSGSEA
jgi:hypothetical protein